MTHYYHYYYHHHQSDYYKLQERATPRNPNFSFDVLGGSIPGCPFFIMEDRKKTRARIDRLRADESAAFRAVGRQLYEQMLYDEHLRLTKLICMRFGLESLTLKYDTSHVYARTHYVYMMYEVYGYSKAEIARLLRMEWERIHYIIQHSLPSWQQIEKWHIDQHFFFTKINQSWKTAS